MRELLRAVDNDESLVEYYLCKAESLAATVAELAVRAKVLPQRVREILAGLQGRQRVIALAAGLYIHADTAAAAVKSLLDLIAEYHRRRPESPGMTLEELRQECAATGFSQTRPRRPGGDLEV